MPILSVAPDVDLYYEVHGQGPAVILFNGLSQTTMNWLTQSKRLARRYTVVCFDARGQGNTSIKPGPLLPDALVADVAALMDALRLPRAHICGFSFGARLALAFAAQHPHRVDRLILTSLAVGDDPVQRLIVRSWVEVLDRGGLEAMTWCALPHIFGRAFIERYERQMPHFVRATLQRNRPEGIRAVLEALARFGDLLEDARRVTAPTLLLASADDPLAPPESCRAVQRVITDARLEIFQGSGHTLPIERPQEWRELVEAFMDMSEWGDALRAPGLASGGSDP